MVTMVIGVYIQCRHNCIMCSFYLCFLGLLVSMVYARGGPKIDLGPLVDGRWLRICELITIFEFYREHRQNVC